MTYIKYLILSFINLLVVFFTLNWINSFVITQKYIFAELYPSIGLVLSVAFLSLLTIVFLSSKDWWFSHIIYPITMAIPGVFFVKADMAIISACFIISLLIIIMGIIESKRTFNMLLRIDPRIVSKPTINSVINYVSIMAAVIVAAGNNIPEINVGKMVNDNLGPTIKQSIQSQIDSKINDLGIGNFGMVEDSIIKDLISQYNIENTENISSNVVDNINLEKQVNSILEPYTQFILPIFALLAFAYIKFLGFFSTVIALLLLDLCYMLLKKTNILKTETITVIKEEAYL